MRGDGCHPDYHELGTHSPDHTEQENKMETLTPPHTRMDTRIKRLWVQALRSGKYLQGRNWLHSKLRHQPEQFCCLGVLCDLAVQEGVPLEVDGSETVYYNGSPKSLPTEVRKWAGLTLQNPVIPEPGPRGTTSLATANDSGLCPNYTRWNFEEIADWLEAYPEAWKDGVQW